MKEDQSELSELIIAAMGTVRALRPHELAMIGVDHAVTMRALAVSSNLYYVLGNNLERKGLSERSLKRIDVLRRRILTFQNDALNRRRSYKMASLSMQYSRIVQTGKRLCRELAPECSLYYDAGFGVAY